MKIAVLITTHNRPDMLMRLLHDIERLKGDHHILTFILADGPQENYDNVFQYVKANDSEIIASSYPYHCGKEFYYELVTHLYEMAREKDFTFPFDYFIQVPDDISLCDDFFNEAVRQWEAIANPYKICLNLLNDGRVNPGWTGRRTKNKTYNGYTFIQTQWVDMCFISARYFFHTLCWEVQPISQSWAANENRSSGVGMQISQRLNELGKNMYMVSRSLVAHGAHTSQMHPNHRKEVPLIAVTEKIIAGMATICGRLESLKEAISSLLPQVDMLYIRLNGYATVPDCCKHPKIIASVDIDNSLGDAGKFICLGQTGYLFFCDDDLIYPCDYVKQMIAAIESNDRKAIITIHGRRFNHFPVSSYYHDKSFRVSCLNPQINQEYLHVPGTGVTAFHSSTISLSMNNFKCSNMADIWLALAAQHQEVPVISIPHNKGWILMSQNYDESHTIYNLLNHKDEYQTKIINSIKWKLNIIQNEQSNAMA